jgi:hypothetical protein
MMAEPQRMDMDEVETREWLEALEAVIEREGPERAQYLLERLIDKTRRTGGFVPFSANTAYVNTIPAALEEPFPGNHGIRGASALLDALERYGHGGAHQSHRGGSGRTHLELSVPGQYAGHRL